MNTITVVIPTYNKADYISQTIESILHQTYTDFEIVIIDDCSQDNTEEVVQKYLSENIRYFRHATNCGPGTTFTDGIEKANTEFVTLIASDDVLLPNHLELVMEAFYKNEKVEAVFPKLKVINEHGRYLNRTIEPPCKDKYKLLNNLFMEMNSIPSPGVSFRKTLFNKTSGYSHSLILTHDYDMNVKALINTEISILPDYTVLYRRFSDEKSNLTSDSKWIELCRITEDKKVFDNYLNIAPNDLKKIFPELSQCNDDEIYFKLFIIAIQSKRENLRSWGFGQLLSFVNTDKNIFNKTNSKFQYKDYINLYKKTSIELFGTQRYKVKLYNKIKKIIKLIFGIRN